jgi:iron complex transport system substrate-binding protein
LREHLILAGFVTTVVVLAICVQAGTDGSLVARPERPDAPAGDARVRIETPAYPRRAIGADDQVTTLAAPPRRIVSQFWSLDEYLYAIVPPERIVGVSETAYVSAASNVLEFVSLHRPKVAIEAETVLRLQPDLVIAGEATRWEVAGVLRQAGLPVHRVQTKFESLESIEGNTRLIGYLTGEDERANVVIDQFRAAVARAGSRRPSDAAPPRVLGIGGSYSYGSKTLFHDILRVLGAENVAASHGLTGYDRLTDEHIARWNPEWIIAGADRGEAEAMRQHLLARPAIQGTSAAQNGRVVVITNDVFLSMSPYAARLVERLADVLYGEGSRGH